MLDAVLAAIETVAKGWSQEVARRRKVTKTDPVADTLEYTASELNEQLERLKEDYRMLTPEQYAELKGGGVTAQTIRNWINAGELEAHKGPHGWLIPLAAERRRKKENAA